MLLEVDFFSHLWFEYSGRFAVRKLMFKSIAFVFMRKPSNHLTNVARVNSMVNLFSSAAKVGKSERKGRRTNLVFSWPVGGPIK